MTTKVLPKKAEVNDQTPKSPKIATLPKEILNSTKDALVLWCRDGCGICAIMRGKLAGFSKYTKRFNRFELDVDKDNSWKSYSEGIPRPAKLPIYLIYDPQTKKYVAKSGYLNTTQLKKFLTSWKKT